MFQYAVARHLALRNKTKVQFDLNYYSKGGVSDNATANCRPFEIARFALEGPVVPDRFTALYQRSLYAVARRLPERIKPIFGKIYWEPRHTFDPRVLELGSHTHLIGYFQCEMYFIAIEAIIREEFQLRDRSLADKISTVVGNLRKANRTLVSVHVRRGDYLTVKPDGSLLVPLAKILRAMARFNNSDFLIFSDDLSWCHDHIRGDNVHFSPFSNAVEDLIAMSNCDHHIIANSSFSWWGAWLNPRRDKIVIAPVNWSHPGSDEPGDISCVYPAGWQRM